MNIKTFAPALLVLSALGLTACSGDQPTDGQSGWAGIAEQARQGIRDEMATQNLDIVQGIAGLPSAELSPQGELLIDGKKVDLTPAQRELLLAYRAQLASVAEAGADIGIQGAAVATAAMKEAAKAALEGNGAEVEQRIKAQADAVKVAARALCDRLPALLEAQRAAARAVPEFAPYANMDEKDILECQADTEGAAP